MGAVSAPPRRHLRTKEAAAYLGFAYRSFRDPAWRDRHRIPYFRVGSGPRGAVIFKVDELERWLAKHKAGRR